MSLAKRFAQILIDSLDSDDEDSTFSRGTHVRVKTSRPKFGWGGVNPGSIGIVSSTKGNGIIVVDFPEQDDWKCLASDLELAPEAAKIKVGSKVKVKGSVDTPKSGWGSANKHCVGLVKRLRHDGIAIVDWGDDEDWKGFLSDLEVTTSLKRSAGVCTVLILDLSWSMDDSVRELKAGVKEFIRGCRESASESILPPENIALVTYSTSAKIVCSFTCDYGHLESLVDNLQRPSGLTAMADAIETAGNLSLQQGTPAKISLDGEAVGMNPRMILFTDGHPQESNISTEKAKEKVIRMAGLIGPVGKEAGNVSRVIPTACVACGSSVDDDLMKKIAKLTGSDQYYRLSDMQELTSYFNKQVALLVAVAHAKRKEELASADGLRKLLAIRLGEAGARSMDGSEVAGMLGMLVGMGIVASALLDSDSDSDSGEDSGWCVSGISKGSRVRVGVRNPSHGWGSVEPGSVGIARKLQPDGDILVDFPEKDGFFATPSDLIVDSEATKVRVGSRVRVKPSVAKPKFQWGNITASSRGVVKEIKYDAKVVVNFPEDNSWNGVLGEIEVVGGQETSTQMVVAAPAATKTAKFCTNCGAKLVAGQKFCGQCGTRV